MATSTSLPALELRRKLLLVESELNRLELGQDLRQVRHATRWLGELKSSASGFGSSASGSPSWMAVAAPVAGVLAARSLLKRGTLIGRISGIVKLAAVAYPLVRAWQRHRHAPPDSPGGPA